MMNCARVKALATVYLCGLLAVYGVVFWQSRTLIKKGFPDFAIYYCAGAVVREGQAAHFYDNRTQFTVEKQFAADVPLFRRSLLYTHPPFEALFFAPFSLFPYIWAYGLWMALNVALLAYIPLAMRPYTPNLRHLPYWMWALAGLAFFPVFYSLLQGQDAIVLLFFLTLAFTSLKQKKWTVSGIWLALGLFKFHLILTVLVLLLAQKKWRVLHGFIPAGIALAILSVGMVGMNAAKAYPHFVLHVEAALTGTRTVPADMPSLRGLLYVLGLGRHGMEPMLWVAAGGLFLLVVWKSWGAAPDVSGLKFSLALVTATVIGYHVVSYDLSMLLLAVVLLANNFAKTALRNRMSMILCGAGSALFFTPVPLLLAFKYDRFALLGIALLLLLAGILLRMTGTSEGNTGGKRELTGSVALG
jgi:hypothetical protein